MKTKTDPMIAVLAGLMLSVCLVPGAWADGKTRQPLIGSRCQESA